MKTPQIDDSYISNIPEITNKNYQKFNETLLRNFRCFLFIQLLIETLFLILSLYLITNFKLKWQIVHIYLVFSIAMLLTSFFTVKHITPMSISSKYIRILPMLSLFKSLGMWWLINLIHFYFLNILVIIFDSIQYMEEEKPDGLVFVFIFFSNVSFFFIHPIGYIIIYKYGIKKNVRNTTEWSVLGY